MLPFSFEVVPSAVNTLLPAFLQVLKAAGEYLFQNACELHRRSRLNSLDILRSPPFSLFFSRGNRKKLHGERSGEYGGCGSTVTLCLVRNLETLRAVCGLALSCNVQMLTGQDYDVEVPHACAQVRRCKLLGWLFALAGQIRDEQYPWRRKTTIIIVFVVNGCCLTFFDGGVPVDCHSALCLLVWGSYWKHHDSSSAMILLTNVALFCASCNKSAQIEAHTSFWSWVSACGTSLAVSFRLPKSSRRIWWQVDLLICRASANMRTVTVRYSLITSLMRTTLSSFRELEGRTDLVSTSTDTLPKTNRLCHPNTRARGKASSP